MERERARLMDAVLDGEATPAKVRELDRLLAADPSARADFEQLKKVFDALRDIPQVFPPEGLVATVLSNIPQNRPGQGRRDQLSSRSHVIGAAAKEARGTSPGKSIKGSPIHRSAPFFREWKMNDSSSRKRNVWIGSAVAIGAALVALAYTIDFPPGAQNAVGTIVPAQRFKAAQPAMDDVKAVGQSGSQSVPLQAGSAANAAANNAVVNGTTNGITNATTNGITNASTNAVMNGTTNAINAGTTNAVMNGTTNAVNNSAMNATNQATNNMVNQATNNMVNQATSNAVNQATSNAANNAVQNSVTNATVNASNNAIQK